MQTDPDSHVRHLCGTLWCHTMGAAFLAILLTSCYSTEGVFIEDMDGEEPYRFTCEAARQECLKDIKRSLVGSGFEIREEDMEAGVFTASKALDEKEKVKTSGFTELATGTESTGQTGRLSFLFTKEEGGSIAVEMEGEVSIEVAEDKGSTTTTETQTSTAMRGHPMMVRYGLMLDEAEHLTLQSPTRERIQEAR